MAVIHSWKDAAFISLEILQSPMVKVILSAVLWLLRKSCSHAFFQRYYDNFNRRLTAIHSFDGKVYFSDVNVCSHLFWLGYCLILEWLQWLICQTCCLHFRRSVAVIHCFKDNISSVHSNSYFVRTRYSFEELLFQNRLL